MRKYILAPLCALVVLVTACTSIDTAETPAQRLYALQGEFNIALEAADAYVSQPPCSETVVIGCHEPEVKQRIFKIALEAHHAINVARAAMGSGQDGNYVALAATAVTALVQYLAEQGVGQ